MKHQFERLNIQLTHQQKAALEKISAKTGAPVAALIRFAVDAYLKKEGK
jgi:predicted DNA-binding protein